MFARTIQRFPLAQLFMPSTRRPKAKARKSREMDMFSNFDNLDLMIGNDNINPIERELANTIEGLTNHDDTESNPHPRENLFSKMISGILVMRTIFLDRIDPWRSWKHSQMKLI